MFKKLLCVLLSIFIAVVVCFKVSATQVYNTYHPQWRENVKINGKHFCRLSGDCGTIIKETPDFITVNWDKWGLEYFQKIKGSYALCAQKADYVSKIEEAYRQFEYTFDHLYIALNPYEKVPSSILIKFPTKEKAHITFMVVGQNGQKDIVRQVPGFHKEHELEVHGLYPGVENKIKIIARYKSGKTENKVVTFKAPRIKSGLFYTVVQKKDAKDLYYYTFDGQVFDEYGHLRYAFQPDGIITYFLNGQIVTESRIHGLSTYTLMGKLTGKYAYPSGFTSFQHGMNVMPNGNFLVIGRQQGVTAINSGVDQLTNWDQIIELDKDTGKVVKRWDLGKVLNPDRKTIARSPVTVPDNDWSHLNSVAYDESDKSLVVSARHIGMVKIAYADGALKWVVGPNLEFDKSGRDGKGPSIEDKVLTAVDDAGKPYPEQVQKGYELRPDFKWPTRNHDAKIIGNGLYSIFDNSQLTSNPAIAVTQDSNAVIYKIDPVAMTIRQVWSKALGDYSPTGSGVTYLPDEKDVVVYISEIADKNSKYVYGRIERYDYETKEKLFEGVLLKTGWIYRVDPFTWPEQ